ncbi:MAG TPA: helix-turn-helix domain-containing protein [Gallicola sp.]|nr:helix-turn-helix domain-containing protein [Gallicola sp.]
MKPHELCIYLFLISFNNIHHTFPTYQAIAKNCSISKRKAIAGVQELIDKGLLEFHKNKRTHLTLCISPLL